MYLGQTLPQIAQKGKRNREETSMDSLSDNPRGRSTPPVRRPLLYLHTALETEKRSQYYYGSSTTGEQKIGYTTTIQTIY